MTDIPTGAPLSALPTLATPPAETDQIFGVFNGQAQLVPQARVWNGAVPLAGNATVTGALSVPDPTQPQHCATKSYVDSAGTALATSIRGAVSGASVAAQNAAQQANLAATTAQNAALGAGNAASTALNAQKGTPNGVAALSANGGLMIQGAEVFVLSDGHVTIVYPLAVNDPKIPGAFWNNGGFVGISNG